MTRDRWLLQTSQPSSTSLMLSSMPWRQTTAKSANAGQRAPRGQVQDGGVRHEGAGASLEGDDSTPDAYAFVMPPKKGWRDQDVGFFEISLLKVDTTSNKKDSCEGKHLNGRNMRYVAKNPKDVGLSIRYCPQSKFPAKEMSSSDYGVWTRTKERVCATAHPSVGGLKDFRDWNWVNKSDGAFIKAFQTFCECLQCIASDCFILKKRVVMLYLWKCLALPELKAELKYKV